MKFFLCSDDTVLRRITIEYTPELYVNTARQRVNMRKPSIKTITVKTLLTVILTAALVMMFIIGLSFRSLSQRQVEDKALAAAELIKAGLTSHMKAGIMDKREYFIQEIRTTRNIDKIEIIRSNEVNAQFGKGLALEQSIDKVSRRVFDTKKPLFILDEYKLRPKIRALVPYIASTKGRLNCLSCHNVSEGTVLGVVNLEMNVSEYRNTALVILVLILCTSAVLVALIIINTFKTIQSYVKDPLESLIDRAEEAYEKNTPLDTDRFRSLEFQNVAKEINLFNSDIIKTQKMLKEKNNELELLNNEIEDTMKETVFTMGVIEEQRSKEAHNHTRRVTEYSKLMTKKLGMDDREVELIGNAAPLHDIGKIGISDYILLKSGRLTSEEFEIIKEHTTMGYDMLKHSERNILKAAAIIAYEHHERFNGTGYPRGLKGEEIHIYGRIIALADVFDALSTARSYKKAWPLDEVVREIKKERGKHFDPRLVDIFLADIEAFVAIKDKFRSN
ncbi:Response regulator [hydrothermal vent metagenome]|uniref:Response regulator n=1 Tax=hydrothermal vent metagenome TaxID=652676 RepID=A0A3B0RCD4_9ZZZZ